MKYIRTKDGKIFTVVKKIDKTKYNRSFKYLYLIKEVEKINNSSNIIVDVNVVKEANIIKDLIEIGDLVVYYSTNSKRYEYIYIHNEDELFAIKHLPINNLFIKVGNDFVLAASAKDKGELELL